MKNVGFIGWRGMVGSVLLQRMHQEKNWDGFAATYFTTSQVGAPGPDDAPLKDAGSIDELAAMDILVTCQGGEYTKAIHPQLRSRGWQGYWVDAASALRMEDRSIVVLDPVNRSLIDQGLASGTRDFIGGNCTVSLMLMGLQGLFQENLIEWVSAMTYQSASGAGAKNMKELIVQMHELGGAGATLANDPASAVLELDTVVQQKLQHDELSTQQFGVPLAGSLIPWIDKGLACGRTREEWKGMAETNRILGIQKNPIKVDGQCVRIGAMRCHSQALTLKLSKQVSLEEIEHLIQHANEWVNVIPNTKEATLKHLTPAAISGTLTIPVGRLRKMTLGDNYLTCFTVGDQLLWGAAEPVRRMLMILLGKL